MAVKHFLEFNNLTSSELETIFEKTKWIKSKYKAYEKYWPLEDRSLVMIFEKASTEQDFPLRLGCIN